MSDEKKLIQKCMNGDIHSFELLIESHQKKVFNLAFRMMGNYEDALDVSQEVFIKVFKSIKAFKEASAFSTWLYRIAINVCLDEIRKRKKENEMRLNTLINTEAGEVEIELQSTALGPEDILERSEIRQKIQDAINKLSKDHKIVIILRDIDGYSYDEIAQFLKCSLGTVKSRINRARHSLKEILIREKEQLEQKIV